MLAAAVLAGGIHIPITAGAMTMDEKDFFSKLNYSEYGGLSKVKTAADKGDFDTAKSELLRYYQKRKSAGTVKAFPITKDDKNPGMADLALDNILTGPYEFDVKIGRFTVEGAGESNARYYSADITDKVKAEAVNGNISVMLMQREKQSYSVLVKSKEGGASPELRVKTTDGASFVIRPDNDTYISSGAVNTIHGNDKVLCVKEQSDDKDNAIGRQTYRAYINFPLSVLAGKEIESAELFVNAYVESHCTTGSKDVYVISIGDTTWDEESLVWSGVGGSVYSWQDNETGPPWNQPKNADNEYLNVTSRFWFGKPMAYEYLRFISDPDSCPEGEKYGPKLLFLMNAFAEKKKYGFNRTLETGERLNRWVDIIDAMVDTPAMTPEIFYNLMSFVYGDCSFINGLDIENGAYWWSNWRIVANAGFFKGTEYFPELLSYKEHREKAESNVEYCMGLLYNEDMSFTEAGPAYAQWCAQLFGDCTRMAEINGRPMKPEFKEKLRGAARYAMESFYPDGYDTNIGDSNYANQMNSFKLLADYLDDEALKAYVSGGKEGNPGYLSRYYADGNVALMRNSWSPDEAVYVNFSNSPNDGHAHPDSNQLLMYAYGKPLIVDSGRYSYSSYNGIYASLRTAAAHNTLEAVGNTLANHSGAAHPFVYHESNDEFEFYSSEQTGYEGISHTRNVLFVKDGYVIVTDYAVGSDKKQKYRQNWHFMPSSNAFVNGNMAQTTFRNEANITIVNAQTAAELNDGYFSANYGLVAGSRYASFGRSGADVKLDTILYPQRAGVKAPQLSALDLAPDENGISAVKFSGAVDAVYYVRNGAEGDGSFICDGKTYATDAKMLFIADGKVSIVGGSYVLEDNEIIYKK